MHLASICKKNTKCRNTMSKIQTIQKKTQNAKSTKLKNTQYAKNTIYKKHNTKKINIQVEEHTAYKIGAPLIPINLGTEEPKPGDIAITMVLRVSQKKNTVGSTVLRLNHQ